MSIATLKFERIGETIYALVEGEKIKEIKIKNLRFGSSAEIGQTYCARIGKIDMRLSAGFVDLGSFDAILPFNGARPNYLVEGKAINVVVTKPSHNEKSAVVRYIGDAKANQKCPSLIKEVNPWGDWPMPRDCTYDEEQLILQTVEELAQSSVSLPNGGTIHFEQTRAICAIDIDAAGRTVGGTNQRNYNHKLNLEAAKEIAKQIRLRNIGGLIIIDFVGAPSKLEAPHLIEILKSGLELKQKCEILPISKFGLCEIARERIGNAIFEIIGDGRRATGQRIAINAINSLAGELLKAKGQTKTLLINSEALKELENWEFDWRTHLGENIGGTYEIRTAKINSYEVF